MQLNAAVAPEFFLQRSKRIRQWFDNDQFLRRDAIEQHTRPLAGVRANIDDVAQLADVTGRKKRETTLFGIECDPVAFE